MGALQESNKLPELSSQQKMAIAIVFWEWYRAHNNDVIIKKTIVIFKVTIKVKDLHGLFTTLFGPSPL